eukprot:gene28493-34398_t
MKRLEVLQEVLLALVGFTGDVVISDLDIDIFEDPKDIDTIFLPGSFSVRHGFHFHDLSHAERDQINSIVPLGRFHLVFQAYCRFYSLGWEKNPSKQSYYRLAMCEALQEMNEEYLQDIANLELLVLNEEALTVSSLCQHVHKYTIIYPQLFQVIHQSELQQIPGCKLLDYIHTLPIHLPPLTPLLNKMLLRMRAVMLKQIFLFMTRGEVDDPYEEFFVIHKEVRKQGGKKSRQSTSAVFSHFAPLLLPLLSHHDTNLSSLLKDEDLDASTSAIGVVHGNSEWKSFSLRLDRLPLSQLSPQSASSILFAGRAVLLLKEGIGEQGGDPGPLSPALRYLSRGAISNGPNDASTTTLASSREGMGLGPSIRTDQNEQYSSLYTHLLTPQAGEEGGGEGFRRRVEEGIKGVSREISEDLWRVFTGPLRLYAYLHMARNWYLLGAGEIMQYLLERIFQHEYIYRKHHKSFSLDYYDSNNMEERGVGLVLPSLVRDALRELGGGEDEEVPPISLALTPPFIQLGTSFSEKERRSVKVVGDGSYDYPTPAKEGEEEGEGYGNPISLTLPRPTPIYIPALLWEKGMEVLHLLPANSSDNAVASAASSSPTLNYLNGGVYVKGGLRVHRGGFRASAVLAPPHPALPALISPITLSRLATSASSSRLLLGGVCVALHNDSRGEGVWGQGGCMGDVASCLRGGLFFYIHLAEDGRIVWTATLKVLYSPPDIPYLAATNISLPGSAAENKGVKIEAGMEVLGEQEVHIPSNWFHDPLSAPPLRLEVSLERDSNFLASTHTSTTSQSLPAPAHMNFKMRLVNTQLEQEEPDQTLRAEGYTAPQWSLAVPIHASRLVFWGGSGYACGGVWASGAVLDYLPLPSSSSTSASTSFSSPPAGGSVYLHEGKYVSSLSTFSLRLLSVHFESRGGEGVSSSGGIIGTTGGLPAPPVCSPYTSLHSPATMHALEKGVNGRRALLLRMRGEVLFPSALSLFFDEDAKRIYERLFSLLFRVRGVCHMLERMWVRDQGAGVGVGVAGEMERAVGRLRHAMHFFVSNLYYYLQFGGHTSLYSHNTLIVQVDVIDCEYSALLSSLSSCQDTQAALVFHRHFLGSVSRLCMLDMGGVQESVSSLLGYCVRLVACYDILKEMSGFGYVEKDGANRSSVSSSANTYMPPPILPPQELESIDKEFFKELRYLVMMMRRTESRGFLFRLDFNGYLSQLLEGQDKVTGGGV